MNAFLRWIRIGTVVPNTVFRLTRNPFRMFVHATAAVDTIVAQAGLRPRLHQKTPFWQVAVYVR